MKLYNNTRVEIKEQKKLNLFANTIKTQQLHQIHIIKTRILSNHIDNCLNIDKK